MCEHHRSVEAEIGRNLTPLDLRQIIDEMDASELAQVHDLVSARAAQLIGSLQADLKILQDIPGQLGGASGIKGKS